MAWRINADEQLTSTVGLPGANASMCIFGLLYADNNAVHTPFSCDDNAPGGAEDLWYMQTDADGVSMRAWIQAAGVAASSSAAIVLVPKWWYFFGLTRNGATAVQYVRPLVHGGRMTSASVTHGGSPSGLLTLRAADSPFASEFWHGLLASFKVWDRTLTPQQMLRESYQLAPVDRYRLNRWIKGDTGADFSGFGRTMTRSSSITFEPGPPVPLFRNQQVPLDYVKSVLTNFDATGGLVAQDATISGTVQRDRVTTGALAAQAATISGSVTVNRVASGALEAGAATIDGAAEVPPQDFPATGGLAAGSATLAGAATVGRAATGTLTAGAAAISGTVRVNRAASGALAAGAATISGDAETTATPSVGPKQPRWRRRRP